MPDNTSNTSNGHRRTLRAVRIGGALTTTAFELFVLAEILWYYLHNGEQTLHGALREYVERYRERVEYRRSVARARAMIRDLPET